MERDGKLVKRFKRYRERLREEEKGKKNRKEGIVKKII